MMCMTNHRVKDSFLEFFSLTFTCFTNRILKFLKLFHNLKSENGVHSKPIYICITVRSKPICICIVFLARLSVIVICESVNTRHVDFQQRRLCSMDFSVDRLNANIMDLETTSELQKIFKSANVSCRSDFTETALMKHNKNPLIRIISSLMN